MSDVTQMGRSIGLGPPGGHDPGGHGASGSLSEPSASASSYLSF